MLYQTHRAGAIVSVIATVEISRKLNIHMGVPEIGIYSLVCLAGAYYPDVDQPISHFRTCKGYFATFFRCILWPLYLIYLLLNSIMKLSLMEKWFPNAAKMTSHRRITHAPLVYLIFVLILQPWKGAELFYMYGSFFIGAFSHLVLDFFSGGLPLLYPFRDKRFMCRINIKTGSVAESRLYYVFNIIIIVYLFYKLCMLLGISF